MTRKACVIGSGPNGLAAAILLAQSGLKVEVFEAETTPGGAARTLELTLPGFRHDFGSAVHPMAAGSPFFTTLPLRDHGLNWIHSPAVLAHPLDDGTAVLLHRELRDQKDELGSDGNVWVRLMRPFVDCWDDLSVEVMRPIYFFPRHPKLMLRFGMNAIVSARTLAFGLFREVRTRALFAGLAAHSLMSLEEPLSSAFGLLMAIPGHAVGWPIPQGGSQSITNALCSYLKQLGGELWTSARVKNLEAVADREIKMCDVSPQQLVEIAGERLSERYKAKLAKFRYGPGVFKVDYALSSPIPWKAKECLRAATVHLGGSFEEIAASEAAVRNGGEAERPFVLLSQPTLFDSTRAPEGKHIAWAYCHVPNGSKADMLARLEAQIERFAPGFLDCVLDRRVFSPADLEHMDANLVGGDVAGGAMDVGQIVFRPTLWRPYTTSARDIYLCSASTPPGGGVHGMCGYHAARTALLRLGIAKR